MLRCDKSTYMSSGSAYEHEFASRKKSRRRIEGWFTKWEICKHESVPASLRKEDLDAVLDNLVRELRSRPHEKAAFRNPGMLQFWYTKDIEETHSIERGAIVGWSKAMDIKDGEQEAQRKFMNSEFDNNYDALPLANDAAAKSSKESNTK